MKKVKIDELTEDQCVEILKRRFKYEEDEIKIQFPNLLAMQSAIKEGKKATAKPVEKEEDPVGWDSEDQVELTDDQKREWESIQKLTNQAPDARQTVKDLDALHQTGADLTVEDLKKARKSLDELFADLNDDE